MTTTEEIVLRKINQAALRLVQQGRMHEAQVVMSCGVLVGDIVGAELGHKPRADAGTYWDRDQARYLSLYPTDGPGPDAMTTVLEDKPTDAAHHQVGCCAEETACTMCGRVCCPDHDELIDTCDNAPHHIDERGDCLSCTIIGRDDHAAEMAVEDWKEGRS